MRKISFRTALLTHPAAAERASAICFYPPALTILIQKP